MEIQSRQSRRGVRRDQPKKWRGLFSLPHPPTKHHLVLLLGVKVQLELTIDLINRHFIEKSLKSTRPPHRMSRSFPPQLPLKSTRHPNVHQHQPPMRLESNTRPPDTPHLTPPPLNIAGSSSSANPVERKAVASSVGSKTRSTTGWSGRRNETRCARLCANDGTRDVIRIAAWSTDWVAVSEVRLDIRSNRNQATFSLQVSIMMNTILPTHLHAFPYRHRFLNSSLSYCYSDHIVHTAISLSHLLFVSFPRLYIQLPSS